jgi:arylsulfatase A-like enzyme
MKPNVCIVVLDAVRAQNLNLYGHERETSPNIDQLAEESVVFDHAVSPAGVTVDSTASLFTGLYPGTHQTGQYLQLVADGPRLAEMFSDSGYRTGAFPANPFIGPGFGFDTGFDVFRSSEHRFARGMDIRKFFSENKERPVHEIYLQFLKESLDRNFPYHVGNALQFRFELFTRNDNGAEDAVWKSIEFVEDSNSPWFQYVHLNEAHMKNIPDLYKLPEEHLYRFVDRESVQTTSLSQSNEQHYSEESMDVHQRLYDGAIHYLDERVAEIIEAIKRMDQWDDTLFIITADHGELLGEHGRIGHGELYEPCVNVPLIIKPAESMQRTVGRESKRTSTIGLYSLLAEIVGHEEGQVHSEVDSVFNDQEPVLVQDNSSTWNWSSYESGTPGQHAIYSDGLKLIRRGTESELYRILDDPEEQNSLRVDSQEFAQMNELMDAVLERFEQSGKSVEQADIDNHTAKRLKDLGYI